MSRVTSLSLFMEGRRTLSVLVPLHACQRLESQDSRNEAILILNPLHRLAACNSTSADIFPSADVDESQKGLHSASLVASLGCITIPHGRNCEMEKHK